MCCSSEPPFLCPLLIQVGGVDVYALPAAASLEGRLSACVAAAAAAAVGKSGGPSPLPPALYSLHGSVELNTNPWATSKFGGGA